jgi:hypothetical protein
MERVITMCTQNLAIFDVSNEEKEHCKDLMGEPTVRLIRRIVEDSDALALRVLMETRRLFYLLHEPPLLLPEFLMKLRDRMAPLEESDAKDCRLADCTYDLTVAKYSNFPQPIKESSDTETQSLIGTGVDCRNYYRAFLHTFMKQRKHKEIKSQSQEELEAGKLLQKLIWRNFWWSRKECERETPFSIRYAWEVDGVKIYLRYPAYMTPKDFKAWLEKNVKDLNPRAPDEKKRIQSLIDEKLRRGHHVSLVESGIVRTLKAKEEPCSIETQEGYRFGRNLADTVAQEKVEKFENLRPAIKALGQDIVRKLIIQIFSEIEHGDYEITRLASQYGISKSTLSRFAGTMWVEIQDDVEIVTVPDLWKNTAEVLAENPVFLDTVLASGFVVQLKEVLKRIDIERSRKE